MTMAMQQHDTFFNLSVYIRFINSYFSEKKSVYCGNYRVDAGEGCDPGFHVHTDGDPCCNSECKL